MKEIEFIGITSGDGECFIFKVDSDTYKKVTGDKPADWDNANMEWDEKLKAYIPVGDLYQLYPENIFGAFGQKLKVKIIFEKM